MEQEIVYMKLDPLAYPEHTWIEKRGKKWAVHFKSPWGPGIRLFKLKKTAEDYAAGKKIEYVIPQKGERIPIREGEKPDQFERWTERPTGYEELEEDIIGYHFGFDGECLFTVETCFYDAWPKEKNYVPGGTLLVIIPAGTEITWYDNEFRTEVHKGMKAYLLPSGWLKRIN